MTKLPLFAYDLMKGHWEVFPFELLEKMINNKLGFTWYRANNSPPHWNLLNNFWYCFEKHEHKSTKMERDFFFTLKDDL